MIDWTQHWVTFAPAASGDYDALYRLLKEHGITPREFVTYGDFRSMLEASGKDSTKPLSMHRGSLVGDYDTTKSFLNYLKKHDYI